MSQGLIPGRAGMGVWPWVIVQPQRGLVVRSWLQVSVEPQQQMQVLFPVTPRAGELRP